MYRLYHLTEDLTSSVIKVEYLCGG